MINRKKNCNCEKFVNDLLLWYNINKRDFPWRKEVDIYKILVTEKLLQQTDANRVSKIYSIFFEKFPNISTLANASIEDIENTIKPLGFWRFRSRELKIMANYLVETNNSKIPLEKPILEKLFGIGPYVTNAVLCFGYGKDEPIIDVNIRRIMNRLFYWTKIMPKDKELDINLRQMISGQNCRNFNWAMLDFGNKMCKKIPQCNICFASSYCDFFNCRSKTC